MIDFATGASRGTVLWTYSTASTMSGLASRYANTSLLSSPLR